MSFSANTSTYSEQPLLRYGRVGKHSIHNSTPLKPQVGHRAIAIGKEHEILHLRIHGRIFMGIHDGNQALKWLGFAAIVHSKHSSSRFMSSVHARFHLDPEMLLYIGDIIRIGTEATRRRVGGVSIYSKYNWETAEAKNRVTSLTCGLFTLRGTFIQTSAYQQLFTSHSLRQCSEWVVEPTAVAKFTAAGLFHYLGTPTYLMRLSLTPWAPPASIWAPAVDQLHVSQPSTPSAGLRQSLRLYTSFSINRLHEQCCIRSERVWWVMVLRDKPGFQTRHFISLLNH
ncbi:uncharacterized protein BDR25DRAFT_350044 [Lindgomyces ingoldianus]|uniref:Uncharacterized protein n=1 Tax=Lindgomyces ingoldianus TaxID=673940 RepID=A0ACB6RAJ2_9PLEO|nr:uncharacterized protein BDR25DRAFT_350044 [Lindgomyces ingoldianus]KAF2475750.1 hypothetical protein BDR25DRAFT_350044 [Lindgomyces ingoldianus]